MIKKANKHSEYMLSKTQRIILITCAIIILTYVILAFFITYGSFWDFAGIHLLLAILITPFIWIGNRVPKAISYLVIALGLVGAVTALGVMIFYLTILSNLANS